MSNFVIGASTDNEIKQLFRGKNRQLAPVMIALVEEFRDYWPMTLRAFYYQAVSALLVPNTNARRHIAANGGSRHTSRPVTLKQCRF